MDSLSQVRHRQMETGAFPGTEPSAFNRSGRRAQPSQRVDRYDRTAPEGIEPSHATETTRFGATPRRRSSRTKKPPPQTFFQKALGNALTAICFGCMFIGSGYFFFVPGMASPLGVILAVGSLFADMAIRNAAQKLGVRVHGTKDEMANWVSAPFPGAMKENIRSFVRDTLLDTVLTGADVEEKLAKKKSFFGKAKELTKLVVLKTAQAYIMKWEKLNPFFKVGMDAFMNAIFDGDWSNVKEDLIKKAEKNQAQPKPKRGKRP